LWLSDWLINHSRVFEKHVASVKRSFRAVKGEHKRLDKNVGVCFDDMNQMKKQWASYKKISDALPKKVLNRLLTTSDKNRAKIHSLEKLIVDLQKEITSISVLVKQYGFSEAKVNPGLDSVKLKQLAGSYKKKFVEFESAKLSDLTDLERKAFILISQLQRELNGDWVPVSDLNKELYPDNIEQKMRTSVSNALGRLDEFSLIERLRKGKRYYIRINRKGFQLISDKASDALARQYKIR